MTHSPMDVTRLAAQDARRAARVLGEVRGTALAGGRPKLAPRPVIRESWDRTVRGGVDPDHDFRADLLSRDEVERRRQSSRLRHVLPVLHEGLLSFADSAQHIVMVADAEGRVLWREGSATGLRRADGQGLGSGGDFREEVVGTNGIGTPLVARRPVQVVSAEHFVRTLRSWACTGAPITDPRDGRLLGAVDVSGPLETHHPATLALVDSVAKLAEARLRDLHLTSLERLRAVAAPVLARIGGPAATVAPARIVLDLTHPRRCTVTASGGAGSWTHELSPRHAELLYLLALHPTGRTAAALAADLFGDPARTVTVRAEMSRVRRYLGAFLEHRPYRFREATEVDVLLPDDPLDLLPHSTAPGVVRARGQACAHPEWTGRSHRVRDNPAFTQYFNRARGSLK